ncbi:hypothetical protein D9M71_765680 [compost metagenome]
MDVAGRRQVEMHASDFGAITGNSIEQSVTRSCRLGWITIKCNCHFRLDDLDVREVNDVTLYQDRV